jgi:flagellar basal body-associated protein FliL
MNGDGKPESNKGVIFVVILTLCVNATIGICTLSFCLITQKELNVAVFTAFVGIVNYILGVVSGCLLKTSATTTEPKPSGEVKVPEQKLETFV